MAYTVYLDAGHGGYDSGATDGNRKEKDDALELTLAVGEILQDNGVNVGYTRVEDVYDSPLRKAQIANQAGADLFVSFHRNAAEYRNQYNGVQTLVYDNTGLKKEMADAINQALSEVGFVNIGTEVRKDLAVLRRTQMPALLVEAGFIDSDTDNEIFDENFDDMARAIAYAILDTLKANGLVSDTMRAMAENQTKETISMKAQNQDSMAGSDLSGQAAGMDARNQEQVPENRQQNGRGNASAAVQENESNTGIPENASGSMDGRKVRTGKMVGGICVCIGDNDDDDDDDDEPSYQIQTGLYRNYANALRQRRRLEQDGFQAMIQLYKQYFAVLTGYYDSAEDARKAEQELRTLGYDTLIRTVR